MRCSPARASRSVMSDCATARWTLCRCTAGQSLQMWANPNPPTGAQQQSKAIISQLVHRTSCSTLRHAASGPGGRDSSMCILRRYVAILGHRLCFLERLVNSEGANHRSQRARSQCVSLAVGPVARWLGVVVGSPIRAAQIAWSKMESRAQRAAGGRRALDFRLDWEKLSLAYF